MGSSPWIFIFDLESAKEAFKKGEFSARPNLGYLGELISNEEFTDIIFDNYGPRLESLRRVSHAAVRFELDKS